MEEALLKRAERLGRGEKISWFKDKGKYGPFDRILALVLQWEKEIRPDIIEGRYRVRNRNCRSMTCDEVKMLRIFQDQSSSAGLQLGRRRLKGDEPRTADL